MSNDQIRWIARLTPLPGIGVDTLLQISLGLDIWECHDDVLVVVANDVQLSELERRNLAQVERLSTVEEFQARAQRRTHPGETRSEG